MEGVKYGQEHEQLEQLLKSIDRPGDYCVGGRLFEPMPRVSVDGVGDLSFPVPEAQIEALIKAAERAPYGKGTETLVDTSVRDCWQIDATRVRVAGRTWPHSFVKVLDQVAAGLGLPAERLNAKLYKLLVYQPGGFFVAHRDTEKAGGMVATLSVTLPAPGVGGELVVRHRDQEETFDMSTNEPSELAFAAFYADCLHEVKPVTSGHRVSLVFNLFLRSGNGKFQKAPDYAELVAPVAEYLAAWRDRDETGKLVWLLEHEYSEEGLSFDTLKNTDAAVAQVLAEAAEKADCAMYAAVLSIEEYGDPVIEAGYGDWGWEAEASTTMENVHDRSEVLKGWIAQDGSCPPFGELSLKDGELIPWGILDDADPHEETLEDYMGNYGPTLELSYRYAALVVWPREWTVDILAGDGMGRAISWAAAECARARDAGDETGRRVLQRLSELWPSARYSYHKKERAAMLRLLNAEDDGEATANFVHRVIMDKYDGSENTELAAVTPLLGPSGAGKFLSALVSEHLTHLPREVVTFLALVAGKRTTDSAWREALTEPVCLALAAMEAALGAESRTRDDRRMDHEAVRNLFVLAWRLGLSAQAVPAAQAMVDHPEIVTPGRMLPAALIEMQGHAGIADTAAYGALWRQAADFLLARSPAPPSEPADWAIVADFACTNEHCARLRAFCRDKVRRVERFTERQDVRKRLKLIIEENRLDLDCETDTKRRPYTLVCTKNRATYKRRLEEYAEDLVHMHSLLTSAPERERREVAGRIARLEEALARGGGAG